MRTLLQSLLVLGLVVSTSVSVSAQWTAVASDGTVDDADTDIYETTTSLMLIRSSAPLPANLDVRYNVVRAEGVTTGEGIQMSVRYRDNGAGARVLARLREVNLDTGVNTIMLTLDSNLLPASPDFQKRSTGSCATAGFDFANNVYYVEVLISKTSAAGAPALQALQVGGTVC